MSPFDLCVHQVRCLLHGTCTFHRGHFAVYTFGHPADRTALYHSNFTFLSTGPAGITTQSLMNFQRCSSHVIHDRVTRVMFLAGSSTPPPTLTEPPHQYTLFDPRRCPSKPQGWRFRASGSPGLLLGHRHAQGMQRVCT